ncbi:MAG: hypothetical protein ACI9QN_000829 [Arcticibacterium sp.]|jgi:hypothetical protein
MKNVILVLCTFLIFELTPLAQDSHRVSVEVVGISEVKGKIYASISNDATSFPAVNFATSSSIRPSLYLTIYLEMQIML